LAEPFEEHAYSRDVGNIDSYFNAHFDPLGAAPSLRMSNSRWPIHASPETAESARIASRIVVVASAFFPPRAQASPLLAAPNNNETGAFEASRMEMVA